MDRVADFLAYAAGILVGLWGIAHAIPTTRVAAGFQPITVDNKRVLIQEWLAESFTMWGLATIVIGATAIGADGDSGVAWVYRAVAGLLLALAILTSLTGARTPVIWFKICPMLLGTSAMLLVIASIV